MISHYQVMSLSSLCMQLTQHFIANLTMQELQIITWNLKYIMNYQIPTIDLKVTHYPWI